MHKLDSVIAENKELKQELSELKSRYKELEEIKHDLDRLKKSSPDSFGMSPGLYSRVKAPKKGRPQSLHEVTVTQALQDQLAKPTFLAPTPPFYFTLDNFAHHKRHCLKWFCQPFYSHAFGYKMCVSVYAGGCSVGEGTHVSVLVHFLRGEFDDNLQWPFQGSVQLSLLNERRDSGHFCAEIKFDSEVTSVDCGRVVGSCERTGGHGQPLFIEHNELGYNPNKDSQYLSYDRLRFVVDCVKVQGSC